MKSATEPSAPPLRLGELRRPLGTQRLGRTIHYLTEVDSTNRYAHDLARQAAEEGEVVLAEGQTQGRGRMGRSWISPSYLNLYLSVILKPRLPSTQVPQITLAAGVAVAETLESFLGLPPKIKWPNDILMEGKKVAGILAESWCEADQVRFVILGIGVNLNYPQEKMPEAIKEIATSTLILTGKPVDRTAFAVRLIQDLDRCYGDLVEKGFSSVAQRWEGFFGFRGKKVRATVADQSIVGKAVGIDSTGALILERDEGEREIVVSGEIIPIET